MLTVASYWLINVSFLNAQQRKLIPSSFLHFYITWHTAAFYNNLFGAPEIKMACCYSWDCDFVFVMVLVTTWHCWTWLPVHLRGFVFALHATFLRSLFPTSRDDILEYAAQHICYRMAPFTPPAAGAAGELGLLTQQQTPPPPHFLKIPSYQAQQVARNCRGRLCAMWIYGKCSQIGLQQSCSASVKQLVLALALNRNKQPLDNKHSLITFIGLP